MFKVKQGRRLIAQSIGVVVAGSSLALAVATTGSAVTYGPTYTPPFHQAADLPITATGYNSHGTDCGNPANQDGWSFVVPNAFTVFVSLTVTFSPGGTQTITSFGPPNAMHAIVFSAPGAQLTAASAIVKTETGKDEVAFFNLSHTCPATSTSPSPSASPSGSPSGSPSTSPSGSPTPSGSPSSPPPGAPTPTPVHTNLPVTG